MNYEGKRVLVLGLGESGLAMSLWLARCGASLRVADTREAPDRLGALREAVPSAEFIAGAFAPALLDGIDFIVASPGLAPERELAGILPAAQQLGLPVWGEIELFAQAMQALREERAYVPKIIAITGTNGKTTVTSLTGLLCRRAGLTVQVAGNISPAALDVLRDMLDQDSLPQVWVLELSSFQLHTTFSLQADVATVLNVTQDHLDWHGSLEAYAEAKARIFGTHTVRVLNRDDPTVMKMASPLSPLMTFGAGEPVDADSFGLVSDNGIEWLAAAFAQEEGEAPRRRKKDVVEVPVSVSRLMPSDALRIRGRHNAVNALAALALCRAIGLPLARLLHGLREYHGEPHRVELIATIGGADYYDDSKGTNVGATVAALNGLGVSQGGKLILIAGGLGKDQDFGPLVEPVAKYARLVLLIGKDAPALRTALEPSGVEMKDCATLEDAVQQAAAIAAAGDAVLLSPACASMDMFRNYEHRADAFKAAVHEIAMARGEVIA